MPACLFRSVFVLALLFPPAALSAPADPPRVAVTIKPIHGLIAAVMDGVASPQLLITGADSPHTHALRPSEARLLESADLVFWIGPMMETSFAKPIAALARGKAVSLIEQSGLRLLPVRAAGDQAAQPAGEPPGALDPHIWLDPDNAKAIARAAASALSAIDPGHGAIYAANAAKVEDRLAALDAEIKAELASVHDVPFITYHDAYQYFGRRYGFAFTSAVTISPEQAPGARRIRELRALIASRHIACVFTEPEFEPALAQTLVAGTGAKIATLDAELRPDLPAGPDFYFELMRGIASDLRACLAPPGR